MPAKPFDMKEYIKSLKLSDEEEKALAPIFAKPEVEAEIKRGWNSQSESSRLVDEANAVKTAAEAEKAEALRIKTEAEAETTKNRGWADALKKYETDTQATAAEKDALAIKNAAYEKYLENIGVQPSYALEGVELPKPPVKQEPPVNQPPAIDPALFDGYVKKEDYYKEVAPAVKLLSNLPFELTTLNFKHMELYGKPVPSTELNAVQQEYLDPKNVRSLSDIAAERLHFADREKELSEQAINERVKKEAEEMFTKRMSELQLPGASIDAISANGGIDQSALHFSSKAFAENAKRASSSDAGVSAEEIQMFIEADAELAAKGIRPTPF